jgi:shikimate kinase
METIILMGPIGVGKTTQAQLLSKELKAPVCTYDQVKYHYRKNVGFDETVADSIYESKGLYAMLCYMNEFKARTLAPIIEDYPGHIIDLGGGAQCFDEPHQVEMALKAFEKVENVFLLIPSKNVATSQKYLAHVLEKYPINDYLIEHDTNEILAKKIVYTLGKKPKDTTAEIISQLSKPNKASQPTPKSGAAEL